MSMNLKRIIKSHESERSEFQPQILDLANASHRLRLEKLFAKRKIQHVSDDYKEQLRELFSIHHPALAHLHDFEARFKAYFTELVREQPLAYYGAWAYFS